MSEQESRYTQTDGSLDELAKGLAGGTLSRGKALKMMGAALFGGAVASIPGAAWAACKPLARKCTANSQCCSRNCTKNPQGNGKICGCPTGKTLCGGRCVTNCTAPKVLNTDCQCVCPAPKTLVGGACVCPTVVCEGGTVNANCQCECPAPRSSLVDGECVCPPVACGTKQTLNPNTCQCEAAVCDASTPQGYPCEGDYSCSCYPDNEGGYVCTQSGRNDEFGGSVCRPYAYEGYPYLYIHCNTNADCPPGGYCNPGLLCQMRCGSDRTCQ